MLASRNVVVRSRAAFAAPRRAPARALTTRVRAEIKVGDNMGDCPEYFRVLSRSDGGAISLASFKGKQPVVLFFYPKAGTPGCTKEVCSFRDAYKDFEDAGAVVFGISSDSPAENAAFAKAQNVQFPLLTDNSNILRKVFGIKNDLLGLLPGRQTYVIDANGKVVLSFNDQLNVQQHVKEALTALARLPVPAKVNA